MFVEFRSAVERAKALVPGVALLAKGAQMPVELGEDVKGRQEVLDAGMADRQSSPSNVWFKKAERKDGLQSVGGCIPTSETGEISLVSGDRSRPRRLRRSVFAVCGLGLTGRADICEMFLKVLLGLEDERLGFWGES